MNSNFIKEIIDLAEKFEFENSDNLYSMDVNGLRAWIMSSDNTNNLSSNEAIWDGKENGRSPESVISTLLVHLSRYAKNYGKSAIANSDFHTQDEFSYLINLRAFGALTKMELIKKNIHDKSSGILIINRLIKQGWIEQSDSETDKRSKVLRITSAGINALENQMDKIRNATSIVTGNLTQSEKINLVQLLTKLDNFHKPIFSKNIDNQKLLDTVNKEYSLGNN